MYRFVVDGAYCIHFRPDRQKCFVCGGFISGLAPGLSEYTDPFRFERFRHIDCLETERFYVGFQVKNRKVREGIVCYNHPGDMLKSKKYRVWFSRCRLEDLGNYIKNLDLSDYDPSGRDIPIFDHGPKNATRHEKR